MSPHVDILDQQDRLSRWFFGSVLFHLSLAGALLSYSLIGHKSPEQWGSPTGGRPGSVAVTAVSKIPLPSRNAPENPVANDTESQVPSPPPKLKQSKPQAKAPDLDAIPIKGRAAKRTPDYAAPNKFREKQQDRPNQLYTPLGEALSSKMYGIQGGGGQLGVGDNSPFGAQFGWYAKLLIEKVGQSWRTSDLDPRIQNIAAVTFIIRRDGSLGGPVQVTQRSGNMALDMSAQRAIMDAAPFPQLPREFPRNEAAVELRFSLK